jgi:KaiC/GvpD/RAD55 family RecA-like ATPase
MARGRSSAGSRDEQPEAPKGKGRGEALAALKVPLPDSVNEVVIIAAAIVNHEARRKLVSMVHPDGFFGQGHPEAWAVLVELDRRGLGYDPATVRQLSGGKVDTDYLDGLVRDRPEVPPNLMHHVDVLRWDHSRVDAIRGPVSAFLEALRDPVADPERVRSLARQAAAAFDGTGALRYLRDPGALAASQIAEIRKRRKGQARYPYGVEGLDEYLDGPLEGQARLVPGAKPGQVTVVTGRSGSGKTTLTARVGLAQEGYGRKVLYGAWEQGSGNTLELVAGMNLSIPRTRLMTGQVTDDEEAALEEEMLRLGDLVRFFELPFDRKRGGKAKRTNQQTLDTVQEYVEAWAKGGGVVILDLFRRTLAETDPDDEEQALYRLQAMAQETDAHFVLVHQQLTKGSAVERAESAEPTGGLMKGSGAWFEMPDTILGVHREFLFKAVPDDTLRVPILKQRYGVWPLTVDLDWDPDLGLVSNGRTVENARPGQAGGGMDEFLEPKRGGRDGRGATRGGGGGGGRGRGR